MIAVATMTFASPDFEKMKSLQKITAIPMAWRIDREIGPESGHESCSVISRGGEMIIDLSKEAKANSPLNGPNGQTTRNAMACSEPGILPRKRPRAKTG